jgi:hypothetical protein
VKGDLTGRASKADEVPARVCLVGDRQDQRAADPLLDFMRGI